MIRAAWLLVLSLFASVYAQTPSRDCEGGFDVYLVLDHSRSTIQCRNAEGVSCESGGDCICTNQFVTNVADLVSSTIDEFVEQKDFRLQITLFGTGAVPFLPLTESITAMRQAVVSLRNRINPNGAGWTHMEKAMDISVSLLQKADPSVFKLLFLVTDGDNTGHPGQMQYYADQVRAADGMVFSVGISDTGQALSNRSVDIPLSNRSVDILTKLANKPPPGKPNTFFIKSTSFQALRDSLKQLNATKECFSITSVAPCTADAFCCAPYTLPLVTITGDNFNPPPGYATDVSCRFETWENTGELDALTDEPIQEQVFRYTQGERVSTQEIVCETPGEFYNLTKIEVRLVDDDSYQYSIAGNILYVYPEDDLLCVPVAAVFPFWALLLAIPFLLFLLWFFFPAMPKKKKIVQSTEDIMVPPEMMQTLSAPVTPPIVPLAPPPEPPPAVKKKIRKWAKVDTSHYIWSRDGGSARPMEVAWGSSGAPESAPVRDAADIQFEVIQDATPTQQNVAPIAPAIQPMQPAPMEDIGTADEADFSDMDWDRCCCGMCASSACSCCKSLVARSCQFLFFVSACLGAVFKRCCKAVGCYQCYVALDRMRPRWDCCGVNKGQPKGGDEGPINMNRQNTSTAGMSTEMTSNPAGRGNASGLPSGWEEFKSEEGHTYFYNQKLDLSQYERPT